MRRRITEQAIKKLEAPEKGNEVLWDTEIPGFGARITAAGVVSFVLDYRSPDPSPRIHGSKRRITIGKHGSAPGLTLDAARSEARGLKEEVRKGIDPLEKKQQDLLEAQQKLQEKLRNERTLGDLATEYLASDAEIKKRASTQRDDRRRIEKIIRPNLGSLSLKKEDLNDDIAALHFSMRETRYEANRVLALLSAILNFGVEKKKWITSNPAKGIVKYEEEKREKWLTVEQIRRFRQALDSYGNAEAKSQRGEKLNAAKRIAANALRLLMLTGSREGEVLRATWEQFDLDREIWRKPKENTKQKKVVHLPLNEDTVQLLRDMKPANATGPLFQGRYGNNRVSLTRPWNQVCKAAGFVQKVTVQGKRGPLVRYKPTLRIHDLRHNYASHLASSGVNLQHIGDLLGHSQIQTTQRYAHLQPSALKEATNRFGQVIEFKKKTA